MAPPSAARRPSMTNLTDIQLVILSAACQREDRLVLPLPERLMRIPEHPITRSDDIRSPIPGYPITPACRR